MLKKIVCNWRKGMPRYYSYKEVEGLYSLKTYSKQIWRRIPIFKKFPYFVGSKIKLVCKLILKGDQRPSKEDLSRLNIFECLPGRDPHFFPAKIKFGENGKSEIKIRTSYPISKSGDVEYGFCYEEVIERGLPIFSADVKSDENVWLIIIGALITIILTLLSDLAKRKFGV